MDDEGSENQIDAGNNTLTNPETERLSATRPRYQFGANIGVNYKGWDLNAMLQGVGKRKAWIGGQAIFPFAGSSASDAIFNPLYYNQTDYWKPISKDPSDPNYMVAQNPNATYYRLYGQVQNVGSNTRVSDKFLQNAAYLRIKNITLSYIFPKTLMEKIWVKQLKLFVSVENLGTLTSLPKVSSGTIKLELSFLSHGFIQDQYYFLIIYDNEKIYFTILIILAIIACNDDF